MPRPARSWMSGGAARTALLALAAGLGVAALCLVVFGTSQRQLQLGVLLGLWGALIAACLQVLPRADRPEAEPGEQLAEARAQAAELHEAQLKVVALQQEQLEAARQAYFSQEIELRQFSELQLTRDADARQESEHRLELALGRAVERVLHERLSSLRDEVAALRAEVVEKLGGQLRLERIETTRVIGSDLEALQHEIRRLAAASSDGIAAPVRAAARPEPEGSRDIVDAELVEFPPPATELPAPAAEQPSVRADQPAARPEPAPRAADPFAALPRLSPLSSDLDLIPDSGPAEDSGKRRGGRRRAPELADDPRYQGRRRADGSPADWFASLDS